MARVFYYFNNKALSVFLLVSVLLQFKYSVANDEDTIAMEIPSGENESSDDDTGNPKEIDAPKSFSFSNCGEDVKSLPIEIKKFNISPDPILVPGIIKFKLSFKVKKQVDGPIKAKLTIERHSEDGWFSLPCNEEGFGSCEYPDICPSLKKLGPMCPKEIKDKGLKCSCPLLPGKYSLKTMKFPMAVDVFDGSFHFVVRFLSAEDQTLGCLDTTVIIKALSEENLNLDEFKKEFAQP